jgi:hypothetical protein
MTDTSGLEGVAPEPVQSDAARYGRRVMAVYGPFGTMSMLWALTISFVSGFRSCFVTTSANSGSSCAAVRRLSRSSFDGYPRT